MRRRLPLVMTLAGCAHAPTYMRGSGYLANRQATLGWVLLIIASAVVLVVAGLLLVAIYRRRTGDPGVIRKTGGERWVIIGGVVVPTVILLGVFALAMSTLAATAKPAAAPAFTIQVIGHRWWWEIRYPGRSPADFFVTANEIHIPVGKLVRLELATADVIHSFWIPQLAGKTDLIPGQRNIAWIEADSAGRYRGQCGEYCGLQHANMLMHVTADPPDQFDRWVAGQRAAARAPTGMAATGHDVFMRSACALCHTIRGTGAGGALGPDLTHLASRRTIAAGMLANTRGNLAGWITSPQGIKPGVLMPPVPVEPRELIALVAYLQHLE